MLIDWFTVSAQVINFLILVWLLKRFLYKPILLAIDAREKGIAAQIAQAASQQGEAQKEREDLAHKNTEFDQQRAALLSKAVAEAKNERQKLLDQAHTDFDALRFQQKETLKRERESVCSEMVKSASQEVFAITRKTLSDLASMSLEVCMTEVFVHRLRALNAEDTGHLTDAFKSPSATAAVRSTFALPPAQQGTIKSALQDTLGGEAKVQFETSPDLVSGIELTAQGYKVSWSIADYLASLEKSVTETLKEEPVKDEHAA